MCFPTGDRLRDVTTNFETCWGFPQTVGAIDGTHNQLFVHKRVPLITIIGKATLLSYKQSLIIVDYLWMHTLAGQVKYTMPEFWLTHPFIKGQWMVPLWYDFWCTGTLNYSRGPSISNIALANEAISWKFPEHTRTKIQLQTKSGKNACWKCFWLAEKTLEISPKMHWLPLAECAQCHSIMRSTAQHVWDVWRSLG